MNFIDEFKKGQLGLNFGLPMGHTHLEKALDGVQRQHIYTLASAAKVGKTAVVDYMFLLSPYLYSLNDPELDIHWEYFSFEIDRVSKEFKFVAFFMAYDYGVYTFDYEDNIYMMSPRYLRGKLKDEGGNLIPILEEHFEMVKEIYSNRIVPIFGEYSKSGKLLKPGKVSFIEEKDNPTGIQKYLMRKADVEGKFIHEPYTTVDEYGNEVKKKRVIGYVPNNPKAYRIIIIDHVRSMRLERSFTIKQNIDKLSQYEVELRNRCGYTFVNIVHTNRSISSIERLKYMTENIFPTPEDIKDSGNLSEDSNTIMTMFNPHDEKYNLKKHFGFELASQPNYRSLHVVESRETPCPAHFFMNMYGNVNMFKELV
jgi:hypothetical protein